MTDPDKERLREHNWGRIIVPEEIIVEPRIAYAPEENRKLDVPLDGDNDWLGRVNF
jgi:hypothetical protein